MIQEMHEEEEVDSSAGTFIEEQSSLLPVVGDTIVSVGGNIVVLQEVRRYFLIQGMHALPYHIVSLPLIETYGDMSLGLLHDQGLEQHANLKQ